MEAVRRGQVYFLDFGADASGSMQKTRPVLIVQNDIANQHSPYTIVVAIKGDAGKELPVQVQIPKGVGGTTKDSVVDCGHIATVSKDALKELIGKLPSNLMADVERALALSLGFRRH